jgi:hypothetical protein
MYLREGYMPKLGIKPGFPRLISTHTSISLPLLQHPLPPPLLPLPPKNLPLKYIANIRGDGIGSQLLAKISTMLYAKRNNMTYVHAPFTRCRRHPDPNPVIAEKFFNLGYGELKISDVKNKVNIVNDCNFFAKKPDEYEDIIDLIKERYRMSEKQCFYDRNVVNVAFHVRRGDVGSSNKRYTKSEDVLVIRDKLFKLDRKLDRKLRFHLFSEGSNDNFKEFPDFELHLDDGVLETFHHLVMADIFVMAKSSFSYSAALYSNGVKICEPCCGFGNHREYAPMNGWIVRDGPLFEIDKICQKYY